MSYPDSLFVETMDDLQRRISPGLRAYDVLMGAGLLRKLILDGGESLWVQANRNRGMTIRYHVVAPSELERATMTIGPMEFCSIGDGLDPETTMIPSDIPTDMPLDEFLAAARWWRRDTSFPWVT
ncbi:MAG: hypothetical protein H0T69_07100 [Thermoleophilaceae bacterium]|nr:hypothetical protein [Thermoleophilaceae bacterium]